MQQSISDANPPRVARGPALAGAIPPDTSLGLGLCGQVPHAASIPTSFQEHKCLPEIPPLWHRGEFCDLAFTAPHGLGLYTHSPQLKSRSVVKKGVVELGNRGITHRQ